MFHLPTFYHRLYLNRVSPLLLDVIYALASRFHHDPLFLTSLPIDTPAHARGQCFAERAHRCARRVVDQRASSPVDHGRHDQGTWEETELAQAFYLLGVYFSCTRQITTATYYLDAAIAIVRPKSSASPSSSQLGLGTVEYLTLKEARYRTFWLIVLSDLSGAVFAQKRRLSSQELDQFPLPGGEAGWARWGGAVADGRERGRRDGMVVASGNRSDEEGQVGELGHLLRIVSVVFAFLVDVLDRWADAS